MFLVERNIKKREKHAIYPESFPNFRGISHIDSTAALQNIIILRDDSSTRNIQPAKMYLMMAN